MRKIAFTGSTPVGKKLMALAAGDLKRTTLELGGSDPMIVCDDANLDRAASAASVGRFFNAGQACLAVKRTQVSPPLRHDERSQPVSVVTSTLGPTRSMRCTAFPVDRISTGRRPGARVETTLARSLPTAS